MDDLSFSADFPTGRRDHSRSPPRQAFRDEPRGRDSRHRDDDMRYDREYDRRQGRPDDGYSRRGPRYNANANANARDEHDYGGMYDDGGYTGKEDYGRDRYENERHRGGKGRYRDEDDPNSRSPSGSYDNRSRSHSPTREAGKPSDTVILEGLPFSISSNEVGTLPI